MQRWKLTIRYDGTRYSGWQSQPDQITVQGEINKALSRIFGVEITVAGQGRTDAGVHALGQTAHVDLPGHLPDLNIAKALNSLLPDDIAVVKCEKVNENFHSRFDAVSRQYLYRIATVRNPVIRNHTWLVERNMDRGLLNSCAGLITGTHDFANFSKTDNKQGTTICTIEHASWMFNEEVNTFTIRGNRFLRHLVRRLVGTMIRVSDARLQLSGFEEMIHSPGMETKGHSAPAKGLILEKVFYKTDDS